MKISIFLALLTFSNLVYAQEFFADLLDSKGGPPKTILHAQLSAEAGENTTAPQSPENEQRYYALIPFLKLEQDTYSLSLKYNQLNLDTPLLLSSGLAVPNRLYDTQYGLHYRHQFEEDRSWELIGSYGSASDELFSSHVSDEVSVTALYSFSNDPKSRWVLFANDSNNRPFLNNIPIPGFAYIYRPSSDFIGIFGLPFAYMRVKYWDTWSSAFSLTPVSYKADIADNVWGPLQIYASIDSTPQAFRLSLEPDTSQRFFYSESKIVLGVRSSLAKYLLFDVYAGHAFKREVFEDTNYHFNEANAVQLEDRRTVGVSLTGKF